MHVETLEASGQETAHPSSTKGDAQRAGPLLVGAGTLIGIDVFNDNDEDLGEIRELMVDMRTGQVDYAVMSSGGFLGMRETFFAVPWSALELDASNQCFVLRMSKAHLASGPSFDKHRWPDMADPTWQEGVDAFFSATPAVDSVPNL